MCAPVYLYLPFYALITLQQYKGLKIMAGHDDKGKLGNRSRKESLRGSYLSFLNQVNVLCTTSRY